MDGKGCDQARARQMLAVLVVPFQSEVRRWGVIWPRGASEPPQPAGAGERIEIWLMDLFYLTGVRRASS